jgi:hypothetical protein
MHIFNTVLSSLAALTVVVARSGSFDTATRLRITASVFVFTIVAIPLTLDAAVVLDSDRQLVLVGESGGQQWNSRQRYLPPAFGKT